MHNYCKGILYNMRTTGVPGNPSRRNIAPGDVIPRKFILSGDRFPRNIAPL